MRQLRFTDDASDNLVEIALYIASESQSRKIALAFVERLRAKCRHLASLPATARPDPAGKRARPAPQARRSGQQKMGVQSHIRIQSSYRNSALADSGRESQLD